MPGLAFRDGCVRGKAGSGSWQEEKLAHRWKNYSGLYRCVFARFDQYLDADTARCSSHHHGHMFPQIFRLLRFAAEEEGIATSSDGVVVADQPALLPRVQQCILRLKISECVPPGDSGIQVIAASALWKLILVIRRLSYDSPGAYCFALG